MNVALAQQIHGWMSIGELRFLAEQASKCKIIIEAGSYKGRSTRAMADNTTGVIHAIDPWDGVYEGLGHPRDEAQASYILNNDIKLEFYKNLYSHIFSGRVIPHEAHFHNVIILDPDMIFIDANHNYETTKRDILHGINLMPAGGFLCGHDYRGEWPEVIQAVNDVFGPGLNTHETIWWIKL
jgi:hypothetical protein